MINLYKDTINPVISSIKINCLQTSKQKEKEIKVCS